MGWAWSRGLLLVLTLSLACVLAGCKREERELRTDPPVAAGLEQLRLMPNGIGGAPPEVYFASGKPYESNAYDLSQGKRLYGWFGCASCHGKGGEGGVGPSLMDGWSLYGPEMVSLSASIREGRPHGMPPFRGKMTAEEIWQLAGYVKTMGAYSAKTGAPGRNDEKQTRPAENRAPASILFKPGPVPLHPDQGPTP
jgi:cytochrome c oxidase cbb3-type subunit 3